MRKILALAATVASLSLNMAPAYAQDAHYLPLLTYRTGPFGASGIPIANGMRDYLEMINQRDGGIGGVKIAIEECETGYDTKKGVECYESLRSKKPLIINPYSTGIQLQIIARMPQDKVTMLAMAYGLSAAADGNVFPWVFNPPLTYWDAASVMIQHMAEKEGGIDKLKGKKLGYIHLDAPYGKEPIPFLEAMSKKFGFDLALYPVPPAQMQNQTSIWLNIRRDKPDYIYNQGWGAMNPTMIREAIKNSFPMDRLVGNFWAGGDDDGRAGGADAKGYKTISFHAAGANYPVMQDILKHVVDKGLSKVSDKDKVGENLYNRGVYNSMLMVEAIRNAQRISGKKVVDGADVRRGMESLNLSEARLKELGMDGFAGPVKVTCADHSGAHKVFLLEWDGAKYVRGSNWLTPQTDAVRPLIDAAAKEYATNNSGWPTRTEPCQN